VSSPKRRVSCLDRGVPPEGHLDVSCPRALISVDSGGGTQENACQAIFREEGAARRFVSATPRRRNAMRRILLFLALAGAAALASSTDVMAVGVCVQVGNACNHYFFEATPLTGDMYGLAGFEYGCGQPARQANGVVHKVGNLWYIGFQGTNLGFDYAQEVNWSGSFDPTKMSGTYKVQYLYENGGVLAGHGSSGTITVTINCAEPPMTAVARDGLEHGPDLSLP
jgi:hypothetical protein